MTDLLDTEAIGAFKDAMRDVTDTFHKYPVTLEQDSGSFELLGGRTVITDELKAREGGNEIDEAFKVVFNREYLKDQALVDGSDNLLITYDDRVWLDGKRYHISSIKDTAVFREEKLMVVLEVVR